MKGDWNGIKLPFPPNEPTKIRHFFKQWVQIDIKLLIRVNSLINGHSCFGYLILFDEI